MTVVATIAAAAFVTVIFGLAVWGAVVYKDNQPEQEVKLGEEPEGDKATLASRVEDELGEMFGTVHAWGREDLPIKLVIHDDANLHMPGLRVGATKALRWWNTAAGFPLFEELGERTTENTSGNFIVFSEADPSSEDTAAYADMVYTNGAITAGGIRCTKDKINALPKQELVRAISHALGHALGLKHDESEPESVMYETIVEGKPTLTVADLETLKAVYSPDTA